jgi:predicted ATPase/DNA-binding SARP family transcriptional activator
MSQRCAPPAHEGAGLVGPPAYLTPLVGRQDDVAEVVTLLGAGRLVSLVGAGGSGKTRLAAAVAAGMGARFRGDVAWVELAPLADPALVTAQVARALRVREQSDHPVLDALVEAVGARAALVVLDSCEHLVEACAALANALLRGCPALRILVTSRQALGVVGEKAWVVPPLALPAPGDEARADAHAAIQLFVERARDAARTFALTDANRDAVVRICRRLDGLPLAIELAAARVRVLPPEQLAGRLDDVFAALGAGTGTRLPRHRTLRALIDWSHGLLSGEERRLFERLAVFPGCFTLDDAEAIVAFGDLARGDVLDLLAGLVEKSLVTMQERDGEARYSLLETVRQYAAERLRGDAPDAPDGEAETTARRHALWYLAMAERGAGELHRAAQLEWLARLDAEHDNLRAALRWTLDRGEPTLAMRLSFALRDFWRIRGHLTEGRRLMEETLRAAMPPDERDERDEPSRAADAMRARVLLSVAVLARMQGDGETFLHRLVESEGIARRIGDEAALAEALTVRGISRRDHGEIAGACAGLDEAVALWRRAGDPWGLTLALLARSGIAHAEGDVARARALRLEAAEVSRRAGDREGEARALVGLGEVARVEGDHDGARAYYGRGLALFQELRDRWHVAVVLHNLGWVAAESGERDESLRAFEESIALFRTVGFRLGIGLCLAGLARLLHESGRDEDAAASLAAAATQMELSRMRPAAADVQPWERARTAIERALGEEAFARAWREGAGREPAEQADRALALLSGETAGPPVSAAAPSRHAPDEPAGAAAGAAPQLRVRALGPLEILVDGQPVDLERFGSRRARELLLFLLSRPEGSTREQVGVAFWPEGSATEVKNRFHVTLHRLRRALGHPEWIEAAADRYRVAPDVRVELDAARFESAVTAALRTLRPSGAEPARLADERLAAALALYRGDFLEDDAAGDWHLEHRERLRRLWAEGVSTRGDLLMRQERFVDAAECFRALLARDPLDEAACRRLMQCHERLGQRPEALRQYDRLAALLREELGVAPAAETSALHARIQRLAAPSPAS